MGFFTRKSKIFGLLKLNLLKSRLGLSIGGKDYRLLLNKKEVQLNAECTNFYDQKSTNQNKEPKKIIKTPDQEFFEFYLSIFTLLFIVGFVGLFFKFVLACLFLIFAATTRVLYIKHNADKYELYKQNPEPQCYYIGHTKKQIEELERLKNSDKVQNYNEKTFKTCCFCGCVYDSKGDCPVCYTKNNESVNIKKEQTLLKNTSQDDILVEYQKEKQEDFLIKLKYDFFEEHNTQPDFIKQKQSIYVFEDEGFRYENDYQTEEHQGEREYFLFDGNWAYFNFNLDYMSYKLVICNNKKFYGDCYIDNISYKTKKLLNFIKNNPNKISFLEVDLKNQDEILRTGLEIECNNCNYVYFSGNKKCPNCGYLTKYTLEN